MMKWEDEKPAKRSRTSMSSSSSVSSRQNDQDEEITCITFFDKFGDDLWQICPLDKTHYAKKMNMDDHIEECKRKCLRGPRKVECPFNPLHIINLMEVENHIMECPNRVTIVNGLCDFEPKRETIEGVAMEPVNVMPQIPTHWENDVHPDGTYDPMENTRFRPVIRTMPPGLSKSQKKEWRLKERQRMEWLQGPTREKPDSPDEPPPDVKEEPKPDVEIKEEEASMMQSIIDGLDGANIADPRDAMLKRINARLRVLQLMEAKLREEKLELQRQLEVYLASVAKPAIKPALNGDPRGAPRPSTSYAGDDFGDEQHTSRILPEAMTSSMISIPHDRR